MDLPQYIEIETSSFCNRSCRWCPNSISKRSAIQHIMPWSVFKNIIDDLATVDYEGKIAFHNYNEPLLNPRLFKEISYAKSVMPKVKPRIYTNGDYISKEVFSMLTGISGLYLRITLYDYHVGNNYVYIRKWLTEKELQDYNWIFGKHHNGDGAYLSINQSQVQIIVPDFSLFSYRGGSVSINNDFDRVEPCFMTVHSASIDYNGNIKMCCNVFPEFEQHKDYILGNIQEQSLLSIWFGEQMSELRTHHQNSNWQLTPICKHCKHYSVKV